MRRWTPIRFAIHSGGLWFGSSGFLVFVLALYLGEHVYTLRTSTLERQR